MADTQNTGYEGKVGHEKRFHKTHFSAIDKKLKSRKKAVWIKIGIGRYKLVRSNNEQPNSR